MPKLLILLLLTFAAGNSFTSAKDVPCNPDVILDVEGTLLISRNTNPCVFQLSATTAFMIDTDNLLLQNDDTLKVSHVDENKKTVTTIFKPPFDSGYLLLNVKDPKLEFNFATNTSNENYRIKFTRYTEVGTEVGYPLVVNCDINNDLKIKSYAYQGFKMELTLKKTLKSVLLEVLGATLETSETGYILYETGDRDLNKHVISFKGNEIVTIKTSEATYDCSKFYADQDSASPQRVIKFDTNHNEPYKCVWTFQGSIGSHYEIDFKDFLGLYNTNDELIIVDNSTTLKISQAKAHDYFKRILSSRSRDLAIIYSSPTPANLKEVLFQLNIKETNQGGVFEANSKSSIPIAVSGNFTILPELHSYAAIELQEGFNFFNAKIRIMTENNLVANFENNAHLPPIIALNEKDRAMFLEVTASKPEQLKDAIKMRSLGESCHKLSKTNTDSFSVTGNSTCVWTIASSSAALLRFENLNLIPDGCLTIQPFDQSEPIYKKCNVSGHLPPFVVRGAFVSTALPLKELRVDASITPWLQKDLRVINIPATPFNLTSNGYPVTYAIEAKPEILSIDYTNLSYVLSVADLDLRVGEKLEADKVELEPFQDLELVSDGKLPAIKNLTLSRPPVSVDFNSHRGYQLLLNKFDKIISVKESSSNTIKIPQNLTNIYIKITRSENSKVRNSNRVKFNSSNISYMKVYDSRTLLLQGQPIQNNISTSDTIIITYQIKNAALPEITLKYEFVPCGNNSFSCDNHTRCVPYDLLCKGVSYCQDGSDIKEKCSAGPAPPPMVIEKGMSGTSVFLLSIFMLIIGSLATLYGPNVYKTVEGRVRNGQYTSFTSTE